MKFFYSVTTTVPKREALRWSWYFQEPTSLNTKDQELPDLMPAQASNIFEASIVPHFSTEEPGYTVCVGCNADAGQKSLPLSFEKVTVVPFFTVMVAGENPFDPYEIEAFETSSFATGVLSGIALFAIFDGEESVSGAVSCFCLSVKAKIAHTTTRTMIIHAIIFCI